LIHTVFWPRCLSLLSFKLIFVKLISYMLVYFASCLLFCICIVSLLKVLALCLCSLLFYLIHSHFANDQFCFLLSTRFLIEFIHCCFFSPCSHFTSTCCCFLLPTCALLVHFCLFSSTLLMNDIVSSHILLSVLPTSFAM
jgi:hypothetical protein